MFSTITLKNKKPRKRYPVKDDLERAAKVDDNDGRSINRALHLTVYYPYVRTLRSGDAAVSHFSYHQ